MKRKLKIMERYKESFKMNEGSKKMTDTDLIFRFDQLKNKSVSDEWYNLFEDIESNPDNVSINYLGDSYYEVTNGKDMVKLANNFFKKKKIKAKVIDCLGLNDDGEILWKIES